MHGLLLIPAPEVHRLLPQCRSSQSYLYTRSKSIQQCQRGGNRQGIRVQMTEIRTPPPSRITGPAYITRSIIAVSARDVNAMRPEMNRQMTENSNIMFRVEPVGWEGPAQQAAGPPVPVAEVAEAEAQFAY